MNRGRGPYIPRLGRSLACPYFATKHGRLGRCAVNTRVGNQTCILYSGNFPFSFQSGDRNHFPQLAGDVYLGGCMDVATMPGEADMDPGHYSL
jgi:hypothetical protein